MSYNTHTHTTGFCLISLFPVLLPAGQAHQNRPTGCKWSRHFSNRILSLLPTNNIQAATTSTGLIHLLIHHVTQCPLCQLVNTSNPSLISNNCNLSPTKCISGNKHHTINISYYVVRIPFWIPLHLSDTAATLCRVDVCTSPFLLHLMWTNCERTLLNDPYCQRSQKFLTSALHLVQKARKHFCKAQSPTTLLINILSHYIQCNYSSVDQSHVYSRITTQNRFKIIQIGN